MEMQEKNFVKENIKFLCVECDGLLHQANEDRFICPRCGSLFDNNFNFLGILTHVEVVEYIDACRRWERL